MAICLSFKLPIPPQNTMTIAAKPEKTTPEAVIYETSEPREITTEITSKYSTPSEDTASYHTKSENALSKKQKLDEPNSRLTTQEKAKSTQTTPDHPKRSAAKVNSCPNDPLHLGIIQRFKVAKKLDRFPTPLQDHNSQPRDPSFVFRHLTPAQLARLEFDIF